MNFHFEIKGKKFSFAVFDDGFEIAEKQYNPELDEWQILYRREVE
jgi:hypothetical protein